MNKVSILFVLLVSSVCTLSCSDNEKKKEEVTTKNEIKMSVKHDDVNYGSGIADMQGYVSYNESDSNKRPVVLIVHEWWGLNDYTKSRADQLAELGYLAMAVDMYGNRKQGEDPAAATKLSEPFYKDPLMAKQRFDAALAHIKQHPLADTNNIAAIGYCFGGAQVLNMARLGASLNGVVSFHGNLLGAPANRELLKAKILVCHGEDDKFVPAAEIAGFKKQMDSIGADYTFKSYPGATHAFTNPGATEKGKKFGIPIAYNAAADSASWNDMKQFFSTIFKR